MASEFRISFVLASYYTPHFMFYVARSHLPFCIQFQIMKEAIVQTDLSVQIVDSPIPTPNADQVLIKVVVSGCNPKDWYA
jgi:hypothetical protein